MSNINDNLRVLANALNLRQMRDGFWRGKCPACENLNSLFVDAQATGISMFCALCRDTEIAAKISGLPSNSRVSKHLEPAKLRLASRIWDETAPVLASPVEVYLRAQGIAGVVPPTVRFTPDLENFTNYKTYPTMVSKIQCISDHANGGNETLDAVGVALNFLGFAKNADAPVAITMKSDTFTLGRLHGGGLWTTSLDEIGEDLIVTEHIEMALRLHELTGIPAVASIRAFNIQNFRWPLNIKNLWILPSSSRYSLNAALTLASRASSMGLRPLIGMPEINWQSRQKNDANKSE